MTSTIFFFAFIPLLALILLAVNLVAAPHNPYMEKDNVFECGFSSFLGQNRTQFSISFFIFALLFLLFDLEILLVYPYLVSAYTNEVYGLAIMLIFLLALTLGFAFELGKKALSIDSRQGSSEEPTKPSTSLSSITLVRASTSPSPYSSVKLPLQSGYLKALLSRILTFEALTVLIIAIGFSMAYRYPMVIILENLVLRGYYPWFNVVVTIVFFVTIAQLRCKKVEPVKLAIACVLAWLIPAGLWYYDYSDSHLLINTASSWLSEVILSLTAKLSSIARGIRILWEMARDQINGVAFKKHPDKLPLGPASPANPPKVSHALWNKRPKEIENPPGVFSADRLPEPGQGQGGAEKGKGQALVPSNAGSGSGSGGGSSSGSGSGSGSSRTRPTSSGDNTMMAPASVQYSLSTITEDATAIAHDPVKLLHGLDNYYSAFRIIDNLPSGTRAEIIREAESSSPLVEPVHHQLPKKQTLLDYWNYKIVNSKAIKEVKIVELLVEKGHVTSLPNKVLLDNHKQTCNGIRNVSFYKMKHIYENEFNSKDKKFIRRHMTDYVTGDTPSDTEEYVD